MPQGALALGIKNTQSPGVPKASLPGVCVLSCLHDDPHPGFVAERLNAPVLKTDVGQPTVSSNLTKPATLLMEHWLSGRKHLPAKKASGLPSDRWFESSTFRHPFPSKPNGSAAVF